MQAFAAAQDWIRRWRKADTSKMPIDRKMPMGAPGEAAARTERERAASSVTFADVVNAANVHNVVDNVVVVNGRGTGPENARVGCVSIVGTSRVGGTGRMVESAVEGGVAGSVPGSFVESLPSLCDSLVSQLQV